MKNVILSLARWRIWKRRCSFRFQKGYNTKVSVLFQFKCDLKTHIDILLRSKLSAKIDVEMFEKVLNLCWSFDTVPLPARIKWNSICACICRCIPRHMSSTCISEYLAVNFYRVFFQFSIWPLFLYYVFFYICRANKKDKKKTIDDTIVF